MLSEYAKSNYAIVPETGCWLWLGAWNTGKYGVVSAGNSAHRAFYKEFNGPITDGQYVCHKCDTPPCVNPAHLFLGDAKSNAMDMLRKNRAPQIITVEQTEALIRDPRPRAEIAKAYGISIHQVHCIKLGYARKWASRDGLVAHNACKTHGMSRTRANAAWREMRSRCNSQTQHSYHLYGGAGISYDPRWDSYLEFLSDMGERPDGYFLARHDTNGNFTKENCYWSPRRLRIK